MQQVLVFFVSLPSYLNDMENTQYFVAKTFAGVETVLAEELTRLGAVNCRVMNRSVAFEGDMSLMYRVNYFCRTALRVLWRRKIFKFQSNRQFYEQLFDFPSEEILRRDGTMAVHATCVDSIFKTPLFAAVLAKDAICDRFRDMFGERPDVDKENPDVQFHLHIYKDEAQLFLDSSGESLHKRGYKVRNHPAPINEVVAAAMIALSGWNGECDFIDPMCGGGTILIEAAMRALNIPAGFYRRHYGFLRWRNADLDAWNVVRREANIAEDVDVNFYGSDINGHFLDIARENVRRARLSDFISLSKADAFRTHPPRVPAFVMTNPPYGERLEVENITQFYENLGNTFKNNFSGCKAFVISSDIEALKRVGLKPSLKTTLYNGPLECRFVGFELFSGDRRQFVMKKKQS